LERSLLDRWCEELRRLEVNMRACPDVFPIFLANYSDRCALTPPRQPRCSKASNGASISVSAAVVAETEDEEAEIEADADESAPWVGDLLVFPLRTIHAVLDARASGERLRLKFFLGVYGSFPLPPPERQCPTGIAVAHGPERAAARAFERAFAEGEGRALVRQQWADVRLDRAAWQLWQGEGAAVTTAAGGVAGTDQGRARVELPVGVTVDLVEKSAGEVRRQTAQCGQLLGDLQRHGCALVRGALPPSLSTGRGALSYLHALMRLPSRFSLSSTRPFDALALHDPRRRSAAGLGAQQLRRDPRDQRSTHVQASHGNTAYGALCAPAIEAALFLQPLIRTVWGSWAENGALLIGGPPDGTGLAS